jgi:glycosyltransferase involved in cell wall biosynthesis
MNTQVCIFFPSPHLAYSPTTIHLYLELKKHFDVKIIAPYPSKFNNRELPNFNVSYFSDQPSGIVTKIKALCLFLFYRLIQCKIDGKFVYSYSVLKNILRYNHIFKKESSINKEQLIIAVDMLFLKVATRYYNKVHFVSLEIEDEFLPVLKTIPDEKIESVIIQSDERFQYIFGNRRIKCFLIQNSPPFIPSKFRKINRFDKLIFNGTGTRIFGIIDFIEFLSHYKGLYKGIVKGNIVDDVRVEIKEKYESLIDAGVLTIDEAYTEHSEIVDYISSFEIGICFYNIDSIPINKFNYYSAPSGKMFNYLAAGVPVIGSDLPGLRIIAEYKCGVLIKDTSPMQIRNAVEEIRNNYQVYRNNCAIAAAKFSFDTMVKPFISYLTNNKNNA